MEYQAECRYCANLRLTDGEGGAATDDPASRFDQILRRGPGVVLAPTLGMLTPGYLLMIAEQHVTAFSAWNKNGLERLEGHVSDVLRQLQPIFGEYLVFEHGPGDTRERGSGACIDHAHLHLIPATAELVGAVHQSLPWREIEDLTVLAGATDSAYALAGVDGGYRMAPVSDLPSQWIRRRLASHLGVPERWNWMSYAGAEELEVTLAELHRGGLLERWRKDGAQT